MRFLDTDNYVIVNAGTKGNLYMYGTPRGTLNRQRAYTGTKSYTQTPHSISTVCLSLVSQCIRATYKPRCVLACEKTKYPFILNLEYAISTGNLSNVEMGTVVPISRPIPRFVEDTASGTAFGVDILDSAKATVAYFVTPCHSGRAHQI